MGGSDLTEARERAVCTLADLQRWAAAAPEGTTIPVSTLARLLEGLAPEGGPVRPEAARGDEPPGRVVEVSTLVRAG